MLTHYVAMEKTPNIHVYSVLVFRSIAGLLSWELDGSLSQRAEISGAFISNLKPALVLAALPEHLRLGPEGIVLNAGNKWDSDISDERGNKN